MFVNSFNQGGNKMQQNGTIKIHIVELLKERGLSKSKFCQRAELQPTQLARYCNNSVARLDVDVLARMCKVLNCGIEDLLEYIPPEEE